MQLANFFISYFLFLIASSIAITAFFCITRDDKETRPDGSIHKYGKIFKQYYFFWFKERGRQLIQYKDDELSSLLYQIKEFYTEPIKLQGDIFKEESVTAFEVPVSFLDVIPLLRHRLQVKFRIEEQKSNHIIVSVYAQETVYIFPEWLRTVMAGCITCLSTVYGNAIYWIAILFFRQSVLYNSLFVCFKNEVIGIILVWLAYWLSLAWLNTVLWNIYNK